MARLLWDPWRELSAMERQLDQLFARPRPSGGPVAWAPPLEAFHSKDDLVVRLDLPGVHPEDVDISVHDNALVIRGERHFDVDGIEEGHFVRRERGYGQFERQILLPEGTDAGAVQASFDLGVLEVRVPHPVTKQPTRVPITLGDGTTAQPAVEAASTEAPSAS